MSLVSVVIPTHFRADRLKNAVNSVMNQTYKELEIIVVSDGYDKETTNYMQEISKKDNRIKFISYEKSQGGNFARNIGIKNSIGEYIAFLDDDDVWYKDKIEKQMEIFEKNDRIGLVYCEKLVKYPDIKCEYKSISQKNGNISKDILFENVIGTTSCVMLKKEAIDRCGVFDEKLPALQDYDLWIRICQEYDVGLYNNIGIDYYNYKSNGKSSQISGATDKYVKARNMIFDKYKELYSQLSEKEVTKAKGNIALLLANKAARNGNKKLAHKYGIEAWKLHKSKKAFWYLFFHWIPYDFLIRLKSLSKKK